MGWTTGRTDADGAVYMMVQKLPGPPGEGFSLAGFMRSIVCVCGGVLWRRERMGRKMMTRRLKGEGKRKEEMGSK